MNNDDGLLWLKRDIYTDKTWKEGWLYRYSVTAACISAVVTTGYLMVGAFLLGGPPGELVVDKSELMKAGSAALFCVVFTWSLRFLPRSK